MAEQAPVIMIMAGGTGGHIFPGLATAKALMAQGYHIHWLGTPNSMEAELVPKHGIDISFIPVTGLRGKGVKYLLKAPWLVAQSLRKAMAVLKQHRPVCVVGMGGYVTGPGGVAAKLLGIPLVIHEQNAVAGLTNKLLSKIATRVLEAFPKALKTEDNQHKVFLTGNPVRTDIAAIKPVKCAQPVRVLVLGGSRGALAINKVMPDVVKRLRDRITVWHQTGALTYDETLADYQACDAQGRVAAFIDDMAAAYEWADIVVCRAGALTVAELAAAGRGAILIPFPFAVDDHQTVNGQYLTAHQAAIMIQQRDLTVDHLTDILVNLLDNPSQIEAMGLAAKLVGLPHATEEVAHHCIEVAHER